MSVEVDGGVSHRVPARLRICPQLRPQLTRQEMTLRTHRVLTAPVRRPSATKLCERTHRNLGSPRLEAELSLGG
jgi:hypothetical protein